MFGLVSLRRGLAAGALVCALAATLALGACGSVAPQSRPGGATTDGTSGGQVIPGGVMAVRPCPGVVGPAAQVGAVTLILTRDHAAGSLRVGELAQAQLPATLDWTLTSQPDLLSSVGVAGGQDATLNVCYWTFRAQSAGSVTLRFSGAQPCDTPGGCSNVTTEQDFTITVS